jgi:hypothetical protein
MTPYEFYRSKRYHSTNKVVERLLLIACPTLDLPRLRVLNYEGRRGALRLMYHLRQSPTPVSLADDTAHRVENMCVIGAVHGVDAVQSSTGTSTVPIESSHHGLADDEFVLITATRTPPAQGAGGDSGDGGNSSGGAAATAATDISRTDERLGWERKYGYIAWWLLANRADVPIVKEVVSYL